MPKKKQPDKPLFDHPKENYKIMAQVIVQAEKAGFDEWQREKDMIAFPSSMRALRK